VSGGNGFRVKHGMTLESNPVGVKLLDGMDCGSIPGMSLVENVILNPFQDLMLKWIPNRVRNDF